MTRIQQILNHRLSDQLGAPAKATPFSSQNSAFDAEEVANNVLGMVQNRLNQAAAEGADQQQLQAMRDQAKSGIEQGISEAREALQGLGMLSDSVEDGVGRVKDLLSKGLESALDSDEHAVEAARMVEVAHRFEQLEESSFELQIKTRDGDQVTLKFSQSNSEEGFLSYQQTANSEAFVSSHTVISDSRFELSIEGELDEEELAAITDFTQNIAQVSDNFFDGNVQAAFEQGMQLGFDTAQIAGFALELEYTQSSVATSRYREISSLDGTDSHKLPGLEQVRELLNQMQNVFAQADGLFEQTEQAASGLLTGFMSHHPKADGFSELLHQHGDDELEDVVEKLVGQVSAEHEDHDD
ncbi:MAG: DUF5610 domain-containing protein [Pseudomonadota bacterium]